MLGRSEKKRPFQFSRVQSGPVGLAMLGRHVLRREEKSLFLEKHAPEYGVACSRGNAASIAAQAAQWQSAVLAVSSCVLLCDILRCARDHHGVAFCVGAGLGRWPIRALCFLPLALFISLTIMVVATIPR